MSSRFGPRAVGTDGTDFKHRQLIASHYRNSVTFKFWLKCLFSLHGSVLIAMWTKIGAEWIVREWGFQFDAYTRLDIPSAYPWEYIWSLSIIPIILGVLAMPRNRQKLMKYSYYAQFLTGILPCAFGLGGQFTELIDYIGNPSGSKTPTFKGTFPMVIIWYIFFLIALQIHGFAMYCTFQLISSWQPMVTTTNVAPTTTDGASTTKKTD